MRVLELEWDDRNEDEVARHRITPEEVEQVMHNDPAFFKNKRGRAASIVMIGPTNGGRCLFVPLARTRTSYLWRPVTAFDAEPEDHERYRQSRRS